MRRIMVVGICLLIGWLGSLALAEDMPILA